MRSLPPTLRLLLASLAVMVLLPALAVRLVASDAGMAVVLLLFFCGRPPVRRGSRSLGRVAAAAGVVRALPARPVLFAGELGGVLPRRAGLPAVRGSLPALGVGGAVCRAVPVPPLNHPQRRSHDP